MSDYEFDVFLSYSREGGSPRWVRNHFLPKLRDCLTDETGYVPRVFIDRESEPGSHWPARLARMLTRSKILVAIYSPQYFRSGWCQAEWKSMAAREDVLGLASFDRPRGLIFPVLYSDSRNFPEHGLDRSWHDMKGLDNPDPMFQQSHDWLEFHRRMRTIAVDLEQMLRTVPPWRPDWPIVRPEVPSTPTTSFPGW